MGTSTGTAPDKALAKLQQWLAHPGNRATLLERPERALARDPRNWGNRPFDHLHTDSRSPALAAALQAAAEAHQQETRATTDEETCDFDAFHDMVVAMELLGWLRIRSWLGHAPPPDWPAPPLHAASALPAGWWGVDRSVDASDPLLVRVMHRVQQVLPGREMLAREFAPLPPDPSPAP